MIRRARRFTVATAVLAALISVVSARSARAGGDTVEGPAVTKSGVRGYLSATTPVTYSTSTGVIGFNGSTGYSVEPATVTYQLNKGFSASTGTFTSLSPGVAHIVATSSAVVTSLVSLSTEVTGVLPLANMSSGATYYIPNSPTLLAGSTAYPAFLYVGSSATVYGPLQTSGSANSLVLNGSASGSATTIAPTGSDTNIGLLIDSKGASATTPNMVKLQSVSGGPVWIGNGAQATGTNGSGLYLSATANNTYIAAFKNTAASAGQNYGPLIVAGSNSSDVALRIYEKTQANILLQISGDGSTSINSNATTAIPLTINQKASSTVPLAVWVNSSGIVIATMTVNGQFAPRGYPLATLKTTAPDQAGATAYCTDCTVDGTVVATGTATGAWARNSARTTVPQ